MFCSITISPSGLPGTNFVDKDLCVFICSSANFLVAWVFQILLLSKAALSVKCPSCSPSSSYMRRRSFTCSTTGAGRVCLYESVKSGHLSDRRHFTRFFDASKINDSTQHTRSSCFEVPKFTQILGPGGSTFARIVTMSLLCSSFIIAFFPVILV